MSGCAPGRGTTASYGLTGYAYNPAAAAAAAQARQAAEARLQALWAKANSDAARLAAADQARQQGDLVIAGRTYVRLALSRPKNEATAAAKERLDEIAEEGLKKLKEIDETLAVYGESISPSELFGRDASPATSTQFAAWKQRVETAFRQYDELAEQYAGIPRAGAQIERHVGKQRALPQCAVVLNEPKAGALLSLARQHEADDHLCCAYWV